MTQLQEVIINNFCYFAVFLLFFKVFHLNFTSFHLEAMLVNNVKIIFIVITLIMLALDLFALAEITASFPSKLPDFMICHLVQLKICVGSFKNFIILILESCF